MESVEDMSGCRDSQKVKYTDGLFVEEFFLSNEMQKLGTELWNHAMVEAGHTTYTDRFHELARLVPHLVTPKAKRIKRNGSIKKNHENRENRGEPSKDRNVKDDNKRNRTGNYFATTANPIRGGYTSMAPKCTTCNYHHSHEIPCRTCFDCNCLCHFANDCRVVPRNVNPINARNLAIRAYYKRGSVVHISFISTTFIPLLGIETNDLGFSYEIKIASGQLVEIDKVIKGCKLEIEGHVFVINLLPFGSGSFDVIIGMDWLSDHKAEIICHEKVVRIPLLGGEEEIVVVKDFIKLFPNDLSELPLVREIKFCIELVPEAMPVAKSPYRLAPSELEELLGQPKELHDKGFIRPSSSPWGALTGCFSPIFNLQINQTMYKYTVEIKIK
nr:reverse transcriptase domain-containing protein [Tanacetum cinerariifolium]